jgi:hypothetical protein
MQTDLAPSGRLVRKEGEDFVDIEESTSRLILDDLNRHFSIVHYDDEYWIQSPEDESCIGRVAIGKTRISLPGFTRSRFKTSMSKTYQATQEKNRSLNRSPDTSTRKTTRSFCLAIWPNLAVCQSRSRLRGAFGILDTRT